MTCSAHVHQSNAHALVHCVHRVHRVGGTLRGRSHAVVRMLHAMESCCAPRKEKWNPFKQMKRTITASLKRNTAESTSAQRTKGVET